MIDRDALAGVFAVLAFFGVVLGVLMMFVTKAYLNQSKRRKRLIELILGLNNSWHQGEKFDFVMANLFVSTAAGQAYLLKCGLVRDAVLAKGYINAPNLHKHHNYQKLLSEFPFFIRWEVTKGILLFFSIGLGVIGMGLDKGWW